MVEKVEKTDQLETQLSKYVATYRKSYKICRSVHLSLQILAGLLGCSAGLALLPAVPIFVATAGALPAVIRVVENKAQLKEKESLVTTQNVIKLQHFALNIESHCPF